MMFRLILSACLAAAALALTYNECTPNSVVYVNHVSTTPYPPTLSKGFTAKYDLGLREVIDGNVNVILDLKVKVGFLWITIPCTDQIGSCDYKDVCTLMEENAREHICEQIGLPCRCPMPVTSLQGEYTVPPITSIPDSLSGFLNSEAKARGEIIKDGNLIGCIEVAFEISE